MTNLVERITITLHRDEQEDFPFDNLLPWLRHLPFKGRIREGGITVEWERTGAMEEHSATDN